MQKKTKEDDVVYYENKREMGLIFKKGISPLLFIEAIKKIDSPRKKLKR